MSLSKVALESLHVLRSSRPAREWLDAFPIGNGRRGAMCADLAGGVRLWLNDVTAWSGAASADSPWRDPLRGVIERGAAPLQALREAIARGDQDEAERLAKAQQTPWTQAYLPLGRIDVTVLTGLDDHGVELEADAGTLARRLDLSTGIVSHTYRTAAGDVRHETFADAVTGAIVHHVTAERPVRVRVHIDGMLQVHDRGSAAPGSALVREWQLPVDVPPGHAPAPAAIRYDAAAGRTAAIAVAALGGFETTRTTLTTAAAASHTLVIGTATSPPLPGSTGGPDAAADAIGMLPLDATIADLRAAHVEAHRALYDRCALDLPSPAGVDLLDSAERVALAQDRDDEGLAALLFHYGRYLLLSSARPVLSAAQADGLPVNLQGLWNAELPPPWSSNYTLNINAQMAHWPAETTALPECHEPLRRFTRRLAATTGAVVARDLYGVDGWVAHHNSDAWGHAAPVGAGEGDPSWATWPLGGVWLALHFADHYAFGGDLDALREDWPALEGAGRFALSWIRSDGERAWTSPSTSPENRFLDADGVPRSLGETATMDVALLRGLADACRTAADALGIREPWLDELAALVQRLPDPRIDERGAIEEWDRPLPEAEPQHRHLSHLVGLFPLAQITPDATPELARAAATSIRLRGSETTGWALAWRAAMWARLRDGGMFHEQLRLAKRPAGVAGGAAAPHRGGLYANLFSAHPPFQLDGNLGLTAAIAEALVQSHDGVVRLLPALPAQWPKGRVLGWRGRGGVRVDVAWRDGRVVCATLEADRDTVAIVAGPGLERQELALTAGTATVIGAGAGTGAVSASGSGSGSAAGEDGATW